MRLGQLAPAADSDVAVRLWTVVLGGLISQQLANQPGTSFADGVFSRLTDTAIDQFLSAYPPEESPCRHWTATRSARSSQPRPRSSTTSSPT
ncbi:hypothetical protein [Blastococcus brunescens]|uniref:Tetracyclin repressor-like C-terminal domain-containing protein n=1 Tax=Blastococcus brunescens TaxID=1564165 RepID=A0ABZ1AU65_9ACTN|nr:hypothetical protein [Blastococcus sp. BMG 8361]WRL62107.1 hypothetical protein U6N30_18860 [Blastococcus sp. BMG 8361]